MSQLKFWNKQNNNNNNNNNSNNNDNSSNNSNNSNGNTAENGKNGKRNWLHTPEALINGHVVYLVKFFGNLPAEQPKGIEVVKDAIRKLQFAQQMKKAETGTQEKFKKVEITISVDGVAIQEPRTQKILHQFPLHNISYCADEKGVKKFFSFIAKNVKSPEMNGSATPDDGGTPPADTHECFVFISNKLASDITLTIGQAFDLAYKKYINNNEKSDLGKAQQQIANLEKVISIYKGRLGDLAQKLPKSELDAYLFKAGIKDVTEVPADSNTIPSMNGNGAKLNEDKLLIDTNSNHSSTKSSNTTSSYVPIVPPRNNLAQQISLKTNSQKMEELLLNSDSDSDFDPRAEESFESTGNNNNNSGSTGSAKHESNDLFGFEPSKSYGQQLFTGNSNSHSEDNKLFGSNNNYNSFSNELNFVTPPLLAPPPKVAAPRRTVANTNLINNSMTNGNTDLFGSDPFELNGANIMKSKVSPLSVDDFSLESLDPLRK